MARAITIAIAHDYIPELQELSKGESIISPGSSIIYVARKNYAYKLKQSPLANCFSLKRNGNDRSVVCRRYQRERLEPAMINQTGPIWNNLSQLADRVRNGEQLRYVCWCTSEENTQYPHRECHAFALRSATMAIAFPDKAKYQVPSQLNLF